MNENNINDELTELNELLSLCINWPPEKRPERIERTTGSQG